MPLLLTSPANNWQTSLDPDQAKWSKLFDILMVFLKEFFQNLILKFNFEKNQKTVKKHEKLPRSSFLMQGSWKLRNFDS